MNDKGLRVGVVYPIAFGEEGRFGGGERYAFELARSLSKLTPTRLINLGSRNTRTHVDELEIRTYRSLKNLHGSPVNPLAFSFLAALRDVDIIHAVSWNTLVTDLSILFA